MIDVENITKRYGMTYAARGVSFKAEKGRVLGLLGQNGAGKTTLLSIITGSLAPTEGTVRIGGYDIQKKPMEAKRLIGYMPEHPPLYDEMTVTGYLRFVCQLKEVMPRAVGEHVSRVLLAARIEDIAGRKLGNLSRGYRQRVGFAQALCGTPEVLVLDEPTAGLDPQQSAEFCELIAGMRGRHTVILSSHRLDEVQSLCDQAVILHHGSVLLKGDMNTLRDEPGRAVKLRASIACDSDRLLPALRAMPVFTRVSVLSEKTPGVTEVLLEAPHDSEPQRSLFTLLCGLNAPVMRLAPVEDSLEAVFLRATEAMPVKDDFAKYPGVAP